jgi:hypothetical protein
MPGGASTSSKFGFTMILGAKWGVFAMLTVATILSESLRAEDYVSDRYGFRFPIPDGYDDLKDDDPNSLKALIETRKDSNTYPISIRIKHSGGEFNPSTKIDISKFPSDKDQRSSLESRQWHEIELPVLRNQFTLKSGLELVEYVTVFPLKGEAITFKVKGPQSRDQEVVKVLDDSIQSFVNLKPYVVGVEQADPGTTTVLTILFEYLLPAAIAALVIIWMLRLQNSSVKQ